MSQFVAKFTTATTFVDNPLPRGIHDGQLLGEGSFGSVYLVRRQSDGSYVGRLKASIDVSGTVDEETTLKNLYCIKVIDCTASQVNNSNVIFTCKEKAPVENCDVDNDNDDDDDDMPPSIQSYAQQKMGTNIGISADDDDLPPPIQVSEITSNATRSEATSNTIHRFAPHRFAPANTIHTRFDTVLHSGEEQKQQHQHKKFRLQ